MCVSDSVGVCGKCVCVRFRTMHLCGGVMQLSDSEDLFQVPASTVKLCQLCHLCQFCQMESLINFLSRFANLRLKSWSFSWSLPPNLLVIFFFSQKKLRKLQLGPLQKRVRFLCPFHQSLPLSNQWVWHVYPSQKGPNSKKGRIFDCLLVNISASGESKSDCQTFFSPSLFVVVRRKKRIPLLWRQIEGISFQLRDRFSLRKRHRFEPVAAADFRA